ncbi:uncharacterized protein BDV17DRAFT_80023 [Aspergillus undulatus]|uniref:uncharacterized protein n=1 Tax=Aspergillus undulatus TaxID=1810928 RepID=UPI003CCDA0CF
MAEELPTALPISFPHELGFLDQDDFYSSQLFETPRTLHTKAAFPERHGTASPSFTQKHSRTIDRLSGDEDYKDLLFTFPRLFSDVTSDRDPFFDSRGMPLNPQNTPISQSGRQSEVGSLGKDKWNVPSPVKQVKQALDRSSDAAASSDNPLTSLFNGRKPTWKPPKPPKPSHLSDIEIQVPSETENVRPSHRLQLPKRSEDRRPLPETLYRFYRSLPSRQTSRNISQPIGRSAVEQTMENQTTRPKRSWQSRSIVPCRYFPRPFTEQELEILGIPLNNPEMPFPAPIPTMDKLPLRRGIIKFDWNQADQCPINVDGSSKEETNQLTNGKGLRNAAWRLFYNLLTPAQLRRNVSKYLTSRKADESTKQNPTVRTAIVISFASTCETRSRELGEVSAPGPIGDTYVLQINLVFPLLLAHHTTLFATIIRGCMSSRLAVTVAFLVRVMMEFVIRWLLSILKIEIAVELRQM